MSTFTFTGTRPDGVAVSLTGTLLTDDLGIYNMGASIEELVGGERIVKVMNAFQPKKDWTCRVDIESATYLAERTLVETWVLAINSTGTVTLTPKSGSISFVNQYIGSLSVARISPTAHEITLQMRTL